MNPCPNQLRDCSARQRTADKKCPLCHQKCPKSVVTCFGHKNVKDILGVTSYLTASHSEDLPTYWLPLWLQWGSNPCLCFDHFLTSKRLWLLKSVQSKGRIRTCNLKSKCQSANHYTVETFVLEVVANKETTNCIRNDFERSK